MTNIVYLKYYLKLSIILEKTIFQKSIDFSKNNNRIIENQFFKKIIDYSGIVDLKKK